MSIKVNYPTLKIDKPFDYTSSRYSDKKKTKLWINSHYKKGENDYYNASIEINKDGTAKINWIMGNINNKSIDIELSEIEKGNIIKTAYQFAKDNNYLWNIDNDTAKYLNAYEELKTLIDNYSRDFDRQGELIAICQEGQDKGIKELQKIV